MILYTGSGNSDVKTRSSEEDTSRTLKRTHSELWSVRMNEGRHNSRILRTYVHGSARSAPNTPNNKTLISNFNALVSPYTMPTSNPRSLLELDHYQYSN